MTTLQDTARGTDSGRTTRAHWWILVVIAGAQLMVVLDSTIMIIALPSAQHALGFSNTDRQWVVTAYTLAFGGFLLLGGRISDMVGPKRTLMTGVLGFALASAIGGASQTTLMLIGARGLQGLFGALLAPSVLSLLTSTFTDPKERGRAFGIYATIAIAGSAFGLILGGFLTEYVDWRWCLYVNLPIAGLVLFGAFTMIPERARVPGVRLDVLGVVLGCGGLVSLVYGLGEAGTSGWDSTHVIVALVVAGLLLTAFVVWQSRGPNPLLPLRVLRNRNRAGSFLTILLAVTGMFGTFLFLTYLLQTIKHYSPLMTGVAFLPLLALNALAATQIASRLLPRVRDPPADRARSPPGGHRCRALHDADARRRLRDARAPERTPPRSRIGARHRALHQHRHPERRAQGRRGDVGHDEHVAADRRFHRDRPPQHDRGRCHGDVPGHTRTQPMAWSRRRRCTGYATASAWVAGIFVLAAVLAAVLINVDPGEQVADAHAGGETELLPSEGY